MELLHLLVRAVRLPFLTVSLLPFIAGSLAADKFNFIIFLYGLVGVAAVHLFANLLNDMADSKSGADWLDLKYYGFFGGSKLIQEGKCDEKFYFILAVLCLGISIVSAFLLWLRLDDIRILYFLLLGGLGGAFYSISPIRLSYNFLGEVAVFSLFGYLCVFAGFFLQSGIVLTFDIVMLGTLAGSLSAGILIVNQVPDYINDKQVKKFNLLMLVGRERAPLLYALCLSLSSLSLILLFKRAFLGRMVVFVLFVIPILPKLFKALTQANDKQQACHCAISAISIHGIVMIVCAVALIFN